MDFMALSVVLLIPTYYLARSKGYNVLVVLGAAVGLGLILSWIIYHFSGILVGVLDFVFSAIVLLVVCFLPKRKNAPGKRYLKITFQCPECAETVSFPRRYEGKAELCPSCGEIFTVPLDEFSSRRPSRAKSKPAITSGVVCFASFGDEMAAAQLQAQLDDSGVAADVVGGIAGGALPQLSGSQGFRVLIDVADWDRAVEIEDLSSATDEIKDEGHCQ